MKTSGYAVLVLLSASCLVPAWASEVPHETAQGLRLPGEPGTEGWMRAPHHTLRLWASDVSQRLAQLGQPRLPALRWRAEGADLSGRHPAEPPILLERTRTALTAHWQPWALGAWRLGASVGLSRVLPSAPSGAHPFAAMPMASYEQPGYRVSLGLVAPQGERESTVLVGLSVPLR